MNDFVYYPEVTTGTEKYARLNRPADSKVWKSSATAGLIDAATVIAGTVTQANSSVALTWNAGLRGYPIDMATLFPGLGTGEYDLLIYDAAATAAAVTDNIEVGFGLKYDAERGRLINPPVERLIDRLA